MEKQTLSKSLIFGIFSFIFVIFNILISVLHSWIVRRLNYSGLTDSIKNELLYLKLTFWIGFVGFMISLVLNKNHRILGFVMVACGLLLLISMILVNVFLIFPALFFLIVGILCFTQKLDKS